MAELAHFPARAPIEAYGDGGFRFAGMSHKGSLLITTSGVYAWPVGTSADVDVGNLSPVMQDSDSVDFLILGAGEGAGSVSTAVRGALAEAGIALEIMDTGAAVRTFNILLAEERPVAAALIAVGAK